MSTPEIRRTIALPLTRLGALVLIALAAACSSETGGETLPEGDPPAAAAPSGTPGAETPAQPGTPSTPAPDNTSTADAAAPAKPAEPATKKVLAVTWQGQETYYWCGPGSTRMALSTRLAAPPSQTTLANELPTSINGTDYIGLVVNVLNKRLAGGNYKSREITEPPTAGQRTQLKADLVAMIDDGFPMVANVVSGWRPPTYPGGTIYHYVAVIGYDASGDKAIIADPAAEGHGGSASWNGVPRTYTISTQDLGTWIGGKGYTAR